MKIMVSYTQGQGLMNQRRGSSSYFYHYDGLGSTKALTDVNQNTQASYIYDAWGNILQTNGTIVNPYIYVGELGYYADGDSEMYLLTQRWYNSVVGRFVARDPLAKADLSYLYAEDNPILYVDPSGYLAQLPGFANLYCDLYALKLLREWDKLRRKYGYYDKYVHCVFSCQLAQECGDAYAECIGALVEIVQKISFGLLGRCDPADLEADKRGIDCGMHQKAECVDCCISKGYRPFPHTPRPIKRPNPKPSYPKPAKSPKPIKR